MGAASGKYRIFRRLATGGMAEVYRAKMLGPSGFEKDVCVKRVLAHLARDPEFVEMFKAEARLAAKLQHANIVQIFDFGEEEGTYFLAMEFVDGRDLRAVLEAARRKGRRLPPALAAYVAHEAAKGLAYAHGREEGGRPLGIVHRDVSPHNILVSRAGEVKVADFGIAKAASRATATRQGTLKGKLAYMSPEQARGDPIDARSDLFSLGVVLHEMLTGVRLFQADTESETLGRVLHAPIAPPRELDPSVPEPLSLLAMRALARERDARFASADEMARALARFLFSLPPEEATAPALAAFLREVRGEESGDEERGQTRHEGEAVYAPTITADGPYPVAGPGDPTRTREDTMQSAATSFTRSEVAPRPRRRASSKRIALVATALAIVAGGASATLWWSLEEPGTPRLRARAAPSHPVPSPSAAAAPAAPAPKPAPSPPAAPAPAPAAAGATPVEEADDAKPRPRRRRKPAPVRYSLRVTSQPPGAEVEVDGKPARRTPFALEGLRSGQAVALAARARKHRPATIRVVVSEPRQSARLVLEPLPGTLHVTAIPWAEVFIDGKLTSDMPQAGVPVAAGVHKVRVRNAARGYDETFDVRIPPAGNVRIVREVEGR